MPCETCDSARSVFDAHIKEAEFLRAETIACIEHVRRLAIYATTIAGFALPVLAGLVEFDTDASITSITQFLAMLSDRHFVIQFICMGVSLTCLAFLRIYVGSFCQIFTFAKYFRDYLVPTLNKQVGSPQDEVFHWENWLQRHRAGKSFSVGDTDLAAEPLLIATYTLVYGALFVFFSVYFDSFVILSLGVAAIMFVLIVLSFWRFRKVLKDAATA